MLNDYQVPADFEMPTGAETHNGVDKYFWGEKKILPFRFAHYSRPLYAKAELTGFLEYDKQEIIYFYKSRYETITVRLLRARDVNGKFDGTWKLPPDYNKEPYITAYKQWKAAGAQPGTPLSLWGEADDAQIATLGGLGVFTVDAFADKDDGWVEATFPKHLHESFRPLHDRAVAFTAAKRSMVDTKAQGDKIMALTAQCEAQARQISDLMAMVKGEDSPVVAQMVERVVEKKTKGKKASEAVES